MMKISKVLQVGMFGFILTTGTVFGSIDRRTDAIALAIQHFNADHSRELTSKSEEFRFMRGALKSVDRAIPVVKDIEGGYYDTDYSLLTVADSAMDTSEYAHLDDWIAVIKRLAEGCSTRVVTTTDTRDTNGGNLATSVDIKTDFYLQQHPAGKSCLNSTLAKTLADFKLSRFYIKDFVGESQLRLLRVGLSMDFQSADMEYLRGQLLGVPELSQLMTQMKVGSGDVVVGDAPYTVGLVNSSGKANLTDTFRLLYTKSWGDCPAGCIYHHYWTVEVTPSLNQYGEFDFAPVLVEETGDPLDEEQHSARIQ